MTGELGKNIFTDLDAGAGALASALSAAFNFSSSIIGTPSTTVALLSLGILFSTLLVKKVTRNKLLTEEILPRTFAGGVIVTALLAATHIFSQNESGISNSFESIIQGIKDNWPSYFTFPNKEPS